MSKRDDLRTGKFLERQLYRPTGGQMPSSERQNQMCASAPCRSSWLWPPRSPSSSGRNAIQNPVGSLLATAVLSLVLAVIGDGARAAVLDAPIGLRTAADELSVIETVQFFWQGRRYCWYDHGWRGPGWYWCGYRWRRGFGWGGPVGWRGWRRPVVHINRPNRPGVNRPGGNRPGANRPGGNRPGANRPGGNRPSANRPGGNRPGANRLASNRPGINRPAGNQRGRRG